jgi:hypothetical protein
MSELLSIYLMQTIYPGMRQNRTISGQTENKPVALQPTGRNILTMKSRLRFALLIPLATLLGCTLPSTPSTGTPTAPTGNWDNWQIQAGTAITSPPTGLYFTGAVQVQGTQSSAVFTSAGLTGAGPATVLNFLGTYNSSTGDVGLLPATTNSAAYGIGFTQPSTNTVIPVGIVGGCVYPLNYQGVECLALISLSPAVGVQIAPLNGTYTGLVIDPVSNLFPGNPATLTLTQSTTPNSSGQFPLSGTITLPGSFGTFPLAGTVSGEGITLSDPSAAPNSPSITVTGSANPTATQIGVYITYSGSGTGASFTGTLTRQ